MSRPEYTMTPCQNEALFEGHEERLQRVEALQTQLSTQIAEQGIKVGYMSQQITETKKDLTDRMDRLAVEMKGELAETLQEVRKVTQVVDRQEKRIDVLETVESTRKRRWSTLRKIILSAMTVGAGALVTKMIEVWVK